MAETPYQQLISSGTPAAEAGGAPIVPQAAAPQTVTAEPSLNAAGLPNTDLYNNILPAINKFSNNALMGIPAAVMHRIGNDANFSITPQNKTVDIISGLAGTGAGIGLSIASGNALGIGSKLGANALMGAATSGAAPMIAGDKDWLEKSGEGAGMGALGAVGGKVVEKLLPAVFRGLAGKTDELADELDKAGLGSLFDLNKGDIKKVLNASKKFSGSAPSIEGTENVVKNAADLVRAKDIYGMAKLKSFLQGMGPEYEQAAKAFDAAGIKISVPTFTEDFASVGAQNIGKDLAQADNPIYKKIMDSPEVQRYLNNYGDQGGAEKIQTLLSNFDKRGNWTEGRSYLTKEQSSLYKTPGGGLNTVENGELADAVGGIKHAVTEHGFDIGGVDPELTGLYRDSRVLSNLAIRKAASPAEFAKAGSKTITGALLSGVGGATAGPGGAFGLPVLADIFNRGATSIANKAVGYGSLQAAPFVRNVLAPLAEKAQPIGDAISGGVSKLGQATPAIANVLSSQGIRASGDQAIPQPEVAGNKPGQEKPNFPIDPNSPQFSQKLDEGIRQHWLLGGNGYADPNFTSPQFKRFEAAIKQHIAEAGPDAMRMAAPVLFPTNPENRKAYLDYISANEGVSSTFPGAQFGNQLENQFAKLPFIGNPGGVAKREQFQAALAKAVGGDKPASALMTQLDRANPKDRPKIISNAVGRNNPLASRLLQSLGGKDGV